MLAAFNDVLKTAQGETIGILSHSSAIRALLSNWMDEEKLVGTDVGNTSVTTIARDSEDAAWYIVASNDLLHLEGIESQSLGEPDR